MGIECAVQDLAAQPVDTVSETRSTPPIAEVREVKSCYGVHPSEVPCIVKQL